MVGAPSGRWLKGALSMAPRPRRHAERKDPRGWTWPHLNPQVKAFLTHLAVEGQVSASTQNQALSALLFLYRVLLERDLDL